MPRQKRHPRVGRALQHLDDREPVPLDAFRGFLHSRIAAFGKDHALFRLTRPLLDAIQETHLANLRFSACCTFGWTSWETSPPKRATSRTRLELR